MICEESEKNSPVWKLRALDHARRRAGVQTSYLSGSERLHFQKIRMKSSFHDRIRLVCIDLYQIRIDGLGDDLSAFHGKFYSPVTDILRTAAGIDEANAVLLVHYS